MSAFFGMIGEEGYLKKLHGQKLAAANAEGGKTLKSNHTLIYWSSFTKFQDDTCCFENESYLAVLDGVILNKQLLFRKYNCENMFDLMVKMYQKNEGGGILKSCEGSFQEFLKIGKKRFFYCLPIIQGKRRFFIPGTEETCFLLLEFRISWQHSKAVRFRFI